MSKERGGQGVNDLGSTQVPADQSDIISRVYREYHVKLYKYTFYQVGDPAVAEDLVSEVFAKVLEKYHTYDPARAKLSTWIYAIANNTIRNYRQKNHRHTSINLERVDLKYRMEDAIFKKELKEMLIQATLKLDERQRNIIALKFGAGETNREIARMLDLTESNVGTILYRALQQLRDSLKEQGAVYEPEI